MIVEEAPALDGCDAILLAQFSMDPVAELVRQVVTGRVLTSPASAVAKLEERLLGRA